MQREFDAVVTLGASVTESGLPNSESKRRVKASYDLYRTDASPLIIMSGNHSFRKNASTVSEASVMRDYALELGAPESAIMIEERGLDTIGNAYFTKKNITDALGLQKLAVVTTASHVERSEAIFKHVMGPEYNISGISSGPIEARKTQLIQEAIGNLLAKAVLGGIAPGDDEAIKQRLFDLVPGYTNANTRDFIGNYFRRLIGCEHTQVFSA